jgi:hypothetical protein
VSESCFKVPRQIQVSTSSCSDYPPPVCGTWSGHIGLGDCLGMQGIQIRGIDDPSKNVPGYIVQGQFIRASSSYCSIQRELCMESYHQSTPIKNIIFIFSIIIALLLFGMHD